MFDPEPDPGARRPGQPSWAVLSDMVTTGTECVRCGATDDLVAHHRMPRRYGGPDAYENLEPVCRSCHPRVEREAVANAKLEWVSPTLDRVPKPGRRRLKRPY